MACSRENIYEPLDLVVPTFGTDPYEMDLGFDPGFMIDQNSCYSVAMDPQPYSPVHLFPDVAGRCGGLSRSPMNWTWVKDDQRTDQKSCILSTKSMGSSMEKLTSDLSAFQI